VTTTKEQKRIAIIASAAGLTVEFIEAELAAGRWIRCAGCSYPVAKVDGEDIDGDLLCEGCAEEHHDAVADDTWAHVNGEYDEMEDWS
jgi:hypothetical protein